MIKFKIKTPNGNVIDDDIGFTSLAEVEAFCNKYDYDILCTVVEDGSIRNAEQINKVDEDDDLFGINEYRQYHELVQKHLSGKEISRRFDKADNDGGLIFEAAVLGVEPVALLRCLVCMCSKQEAVEVDESTYLINPT